MDLLGYVPFGVGQEFTISDERRTGSGSADAALGRFGGNQEKVAAPIELKGPHTVDLDAIMPGRHKSAVQQAWEYAMDTPDCRFVIVSNMIEIRLYAVGHTRQLFERFDILDLADSDTAYQHFRLLLGAQNLLAGRTAELLQDSAKAEKEITQKLYNDYRTWRVNLLIGLLQSNDVGAERLIESVQKLLDRVLFVAFAEDRGLLPSRTLTSAWEHRNPYNPRPVWENFKGLFRSIDVGNRNLGIPAYNGGLFAADPLLYALVVPDDACTMFGALGDYDFAEDVSVGVLGHIFEQSVSDIEQLKELAGTEGFTLSALQQQANDKARAVSGKRKAEGIVYTPDAITRFIVDETLCSYLKERLDVLRAQYVLADEAWRKPTDTERKLTRGSTRDRARNIKVSEDRLVEFLFWTAWRDVLKEIKILDPACGSGAFLVAAFDALDVEYRRANEQIQAITGTPDFFDINREILNSNLYGVDLNPESIEITKLSLWLKTAKHGKALESLEANLRVGNSLIDEMNGGVDFSPRAFDWRGAFPEVFGRGGFDIVLGNPPYVRMERIKPVKPYLEKHYEVASDRADLYYYFYELGVRLLKPGGRLGYISSSTFFNTGSGEPLRRYLRTHTQLRTLVDFGDVRVFEGVTTYPAIVVLDKIATPNSDALIRFFGLEEHMPDSIAIEFERKAGTMPQAQLGLGSWRLESSESARLRDKLTRGHSRLTEVYGSPLYGIKTGLNAAFVIDGATRDRLVAEDHRCSTLLKPFIDGENISKWFVEHRNRWLSFIPKGAVDIDAYPSISRTRLAHESIGR